MMDVTGNNIANVNSVGFKASQVVFDDTLSQLMTAAGAPQQGQGGTNPAQVGLGVRTTAINTSFVQGSAETTNRPTDLMISGDGFFVVKSVNEQLFTRAGAFNFDADGKLVTATGAAVQGWPAVAGVVNTNGTIGDIVLPVGTLIAPVPTKNVTLAGNLQADAVDLTSIPRSVKIYDSQGTAIPLTMTFTKQSTFTPPTYDVTVTDSLGDTPVVQTLTFDPNTHQLAAPTPMPLPFTMASGQVINIDLAGLNFYTSGTTVNVLSQDGTPAATLTSFTINPDGQLVGIFSNGLKQTVAQLALANFNNPPGLERTGDGLYRFTVNSGLAQVGIAGTNGLGVLQAGAIEMSNVDLAQEFTNLIIAQRGFEANSKVISTSDEMLQDLVNLKR
jgi:flagellar hook protein FlgE